MRKIVSLCACLVFTIAVTACSGGGNGAAPSSAPSGLASGTANPAAGGIEPPKASPAGSAVSGDIPDALKDPDPNGQKTIVFRSYDYNAMYERAARSYKEKHPYVTIKFEYYRNGSNDLNGSKLKQFREKTNAELIAGKGPDLIDMDWLPIGRYAGRNMLTDIGALMDKDSAFEKERYFGNILSATLTAGGLYTMPLFFSLEMLVGDDEAIREAGVVIDDKSWNWDEFAMTAEQLVKQGGYSYGYSSKGDTYFLYRLLTANYSRYVDEKNRKAYFDSEEFIGLMNRIQSMESNKAITFDHYEDVYFMDGGANNPLEFLQLVKGSSFKQPKLYAYPAIEGHDSGGYFTPYNNIAINAESKVQVAAWDFLKYLSAQEAEETSLTMFPINKDAYEAEKNRLLAKGKVTGEEYGYPEGPELEITQEDFAALNELIANAKRASLRLPGTVEEVMFNEAPAFFKGQKSAEAVASLIQNKAMTYLNE